jgi:hypothetical protein
MTLINQRKFPIGFVGTSFNNNDFTRLNYTMFANEHGRAEIVTNTTLTDFDRTWTTNQWIGKTVITGSDSGITTGTVTANNANTLTVSNWSNGNPSTADLPLLYIIDTNNKITKIATGSKKTNQIKILDKTNLSVGQYVTGNGIPSFYSSSSVNVKETVVSLHETSKTSYVTVTAISSTVDGNGKYTVTLSGNLISDVNGDINFYNNNSNYEYQFELLKGAGIESIRTFMSWGSIEPYPAIFGQGVVTNIPATGNLPEQFTIQFINNTGTSTFLSQITNGTGYYLTDSSKNWMTNQWASNTNVTFTLTAANNSTAQIYANTATKLTLGPWSGSTPSNGTGYVISANIAENQFTNATLVVNPDVNGVTNFAEINSEVKITSNSTWNNNATIISVQGSTYWKGYSPTSTVWNNILNSGKVSFLLKNGSIKSNYYFAKQPPSSSTKPRDYLGNYTDDIESFVMLAAKNGINVRPVVLNGPPAWFKNSYYDTVAHSPWVVEVQTTQGSQYVYIKTKPYDMWDENLDTAHMLMPKMIVNNIPVNGSNTIIVANDEKYANAIRKNTNGYFIKLSNSASATGTYNLIADIKNFFNNNNYATMSDLNNVGNNQKEFNDRFQFDSINDWKIFSNQIQKKNYPKGYYIPKHNDAINYVNNIINRFGTNGTFWNSPNNLYAKSITNKTIYGNSIYSTNLDNTNNKYQQVVTVSSSSGLSTGMWIEDATTKSDGNNSLIPQNIKICGIDGNNLILEDNLNQTILSTNPIPVTISVPKVLNFQISNEVDGQDSGALGFKAKINNNDTLPVSFSAPSWPNCPSVPKLPFQNSKNKSMKLINYLGSSAKANSWGPSYLGLIGKIKLDAHSTDKNVNIVTCGLTKDGSSIVNGLNHLFKTGNLNDINKVDKIAIHPYPLGASSKNTVNQLKDCFTTLEKIYGVGTNEQPTIPPFVCSEFGVSTPIVDGSRGPNSKNIGFGALGSQSQQKTYITGLFNSGKTDINNPANWGAFINNKYGRKLDCASYFRWSSPETVSTENIDPIINTKNLDQWRGLNFFIQPMKISNITVVTHSGSRTAELYGSDLQYLLNETQYTIYSSHILQANNITFTTGSHSGLVKTGPYTITLSGDPSGSSLSAPGESATIALYDLTPYINGIWYPKLSALAMQNQALANEGRI